MPMRCTICRHPKHDEINTAIVSQVSYRAIARKYGVGYRSVGRHLNCLKRMIRAALCKRNDTQRHKMSHNVALSAEKSDEMAVLKRIRGVFCASKCVSICDEMPRYCDEMGLKRAK